MTKEFSRKITVFSLILMIGLMPALSYAKGNDDNKNRGKNSDRSERVEKNDDHDDDDDKDDNRIGDRRENWTEKKAKQEITKSCRKIFKRLFGIGFFGNNADINLLIECLRPFGVNATFSGTASTTPDTIPPVLSNISAKPNTVKAEIRWNTNEKSDSTVFWSNASGVNVNSSSTATLTKSDKVKEHKLTIEGLSASTTYYFVVRSKDASGNTTTSSEGSFTTKSVSADTTYPVISSVTLLVGTSSASIGWHTNENATSRVYYGTSAGLDVNASTTSFVENSTPKQTHSVTISGLATSTLYYFAAESKDASGNRTVTPVFSATTLGL